MDALARHAVALGIALLCGRLAAQDSRAPAEPKPVPPRYAMDYGPFLSGTIRADWPAGNVALKGIAVRLAGGQAGMLFDTELLRWAAAWTGGFLELQGTAYDGAHGPSPRIEGVQVLGTAARPGWAYGGSFEDPRVIPYGPLPRVRGRYQGLYRHGTRVIVAYDVEGTRVLESPGASVDEDGAVVELWRQIEVGPHEQELQLAVGVRAGATLELDPRARVVRWLWPDPPAGEPEPARLAVVAGLTGLDPAAFEWRAAGDRVVLALAPSAQTVRFRLRLRASAAEVPPALPAPAAAEVTPLAVLLAGGPSLWNVPVVTHGIRAPDDAAYVVDTLTVPYDNPWHSRMRLGALDMFSDGRIAVSTWNGDVWIVSGIDDDLRELRWRRFATGLYDPLGLRIVDDVVYTLGRDQITRLHDLDGDGEADFYECFSNDMLVTANFHEFAFDLQTDAAGNFYFAKAAPVRPGGRGFDPIVPHHGKILRVSPDGKKLEIYAGGLRAPNGIGVGPDGQVTSGDNEGTWMPRCRLNWVQPGAFLGCRATAIQDPPPAHYDPPLCWLPMEVDNSSGGQVWVTSQRWGPWEGELLHMSYGTCSLLAVLRQKVDGVMQGGVVRFPLEFVSSTRRGRFHPVDGQLYVCGLKGWQTSAARVGGLQRVRYTGAPVLMPSALSVWKDGIAVSFFVPLDAELATDVGSWALEQWSYVWSERYGSPEISLSTPEADLSKAAADWNGFSHRDPVAVQQARLSADGKTVLLVIDDLQPVMQMRIRYDLDTAAGKMLRGEIYHTIHRVPDRRFGGGLPR